MDHKDAVRLKATERYLLNELDPDQLDQFEEHLFDCPDCALEVRAAAMFVEQSKAVLAEDTRPSPVAVAAPARKAWFSWLRPALVVPAMAVLLVVVGYQNLVELPTIRSASAVPQVMPSASMNIATRGANVPVISARKGQNFSLLIDLPPDNGFSSYIADLYNPAGKIEWSLAIPAEAVVNDSVTIRVPGTERSAGAYVLAVRGVRAGASPSEIGRHPFELRLQ
jgi:anti-sigma factor RsiW